MKIINSEAPSRPALRYHGGKWILAPWIISHFPEHRIYVEPFGGAASVMLRKPRCYSEIYNDLSGDVCNFFQVVRDYGELLKLRLQNTPYARAEYVKARAVVDMTDVERARATVIRSFMGFGSGSTGQHYNTGFRSNANRNGTTPAHDWVNYADRMDTLIARLRGVVIENKAAISVIEQQDGPSTLFYVDPPYPLATRNNRHVYEHELGESDHRSLAVALHKVQGKVLIGGYPCPLYDEIYAGWRFVSRRALADGARKRTEILWMNF